MNFLNNFNKIFMTKRSLDNEGNSDGKRADSASNNDSEVNENDAVFVAEILLLSIRALEALQ